ncbi:hypothetical protein K461DRAFT_280111 [Myriangium duriaei CBS 260.36]|uniref:Uncharacterized protein n=1 Tax=Myriangium duriaei CBS 260.36 TaxID=1168546 RepID=A0A9P4J2Q6_9PEZI|nr:hypothetical protein K461DRAFT_280111 [Myriangium duriaei CBS 260.36]
MHAEIGSVWRHVDQCRDQLQARTEVPGAGAGAGAGAKADDGDIDVLTSQLLSVANKANEVDGLKVQVEVMTRRLRRLEGNSSPSVAALPPPADAAAYHHAHPPPPHQYPQQAHPPQHPPPGKPVEEARPTSHPVAESRIPPASQLHQPESRPAPEATQGADPRSIPGFRALESSSNVGSWRAASHQAPPPQEAAPAPRHDAPTTSGWAAVNSVHHTKRAASIDGNVPLDGSAPGSPKRQKLATLMPRAAYGEQPPAQAGPYHQSPDARPSTGDAAHPNNAQGLRFVPFPRENGHEAWHHSEHAARGRGSGRGRGRGRRSGHEGEDGEVKHEHEWREWPGQDYHRHPQHAYAISSDPYRGRELQPAGYSPEGHHTMPAPETPSPALPENGGKKSRTKPTRNADGILIRKDGRPDMRSISSAQNLRKVHAKKEAERTAELQGGDRGTPGPGDDRSVIDGVSASASPRSPSNITLRREGSGVPDGGSERSVSGSAPHGYEAPQSQPQQQQDAVMMDAGMRERQEKAVEGPRAAAEAHAVVV